MSSRHYSLRFFQILGKRGAPALDFCNMSERCLVQGLLADFSSVVLDGVQQLLQRQCWQLLDGGIHCLIVLADRREALQPLQKLDHWCEVSSCNVDCGLSGSRQRSCVEVLWLSIVRSSPVFER